MKAVILAGGLGTRLSEETGNRPKPMVEVDDQPLIGHIVKKCKHIGIKNVIINLFYLGDKIINYFKTNKVNCFKYNYALEEIVQNFSIIESTIQLSQDGQSIALITRKPLDFQSLDTVIDPESEILGTLYESKSSASFRL